MTVLRITARQTHRVAGIIMLVVSAAAAVVPARRAGSVDPIVVLRDE